jgi:3-phytase
LLETFNLAANDEDNNTKEKIADFENLPVIGTTIAGETINLGGFSGLVYLGQDPSTLKMQFLTLTDRGPNTEPTLMPFDHQLHRGFGLPDFTPELVQFTLDPETNNIELNKRTPLRGPQGEPMSGLPVRPGNPKIIGQDESGVDLHGKLLSAHKLGIDPECVAIAEDGSYWIGEEYYPSILHFDNQGALIERFIPKGASPTIGSIDSLPAIYMARQPNNGFEGLTISGNIIYAFVQSPFGLIENDRGQVVPPSKFGRILAFDTIKKQPIAEYLYEFEGHSSDKIGDVTLGHDGNLWVIEQNGKTNGKAMKAVFSIDLSKATNILGFSPPPELEDHLDQKNIKPARKSLMIDLAKTSLKNFEKLEGLAQLDKNHIAIVNDDDFGIKAQFDPNTGRILERRNEPEGEHLFRIKIK